MFINLAIAEDCNLATYDACTSKDRRKRTLPHLLVFMGLDFMEIKLKHFFTRHQSETKNGNRQENGASDLGEGPILDSFWASQLSCPVACLNQV